MSAAGPYSPTQVQDAIAAALRVRAVTVSPPTPHYALVILRCLPGPLPIPQSFERKSPGYNPLLRALTVYLTVPVHQVATLTLLVSPLDSWRRSRLSNLSQSFRTGKFPIIRCTTG